MERVLRFYKTEENRWFVDLPEWPVEYIDALEMVAGADTMLDILSKNGDNVLLKISTEEREGYIARLDIKELPENDFEGAFYMCDIAGGNSQNNPFEVWLCGVTKYVFSKYPLTILIYK